VGPADDPALLLEELLPMSVAPGVAPVVSAVPAAPVVSVLPMELAPPAVPVLSIGVVLIVPGDVVVSVAGLEPAVSASSLRPHALSVSAPATKHAARAALPMLVFVFISILPILSDLGFEFFSHEQMRMLASIRVAPFSAVAVPARCATGALRGHYICLC
jgi:hypothetical protein